MDDQNSATTASPRRGSAGRKFLRRLVCGTVVAAAVAGPLAVSVGPTDHTVGAVADVAAVRTMQPMQPPVPPGPPVPPPMQEPGQEGPDSSIHGDPPPRFGDPGSCADFIIVGGYPMLNNDKPRGCTEA